jgi:hypothetical protein
LLGGVPQRRLAEQARRHTMECRDISPSVAEYVDRSPEGMRAGLGAARRSARGRTHAAATSIFIHASIVSAAPSDTRPCAAGSAMWMALLTWLTGSMQK